MRIEDSFTSAISFSSKKIISFVLSGKPKTSELTALYPSPLPRTKGLPLLVTYIDFEPLTKKAKENEPIIFLFRFLIASIGLLNSFNNLFYISAIISESVSDLIFFCFIE